MRTAENVLVEVGQMKAVVGTMTQGTMKVIDVHEQKGSIADLVELAKKEAGLVLLKSGQPVAQIIPVPCPPTNRIAPLHPNSMEVSDDFDAPLPDEFWLGRA